MFDRFRRQLFIFSLLSFSILISELCAYEPLVTVGKPSLCDILYSPDGRFLAILTTSYLEILDAKTLDPVTRVAANGYQLAFSPDSSLLAIFGRYKDVIHIWHVDSETFLTTIPVFSRDVAFSPDGKYLAYADGDSVFLWDVEQRETVLELTGDPQPSSKPESSQGVKAFAFHPNSRILAVGSMRQTISLWDIQTQEIISYLELGIEYRPDVMSFSHSGELLAAIARYSSQPGYTIRLWDVSTGDSQYRSGHFSDLIFTHDDQHLLVGGGNGNLHVIETDTFDVEKISAIDRPPPASYSINNNCLESLTFHPDEARFACLINGSRICFWDVQDFSRRQKVYGYGYAHSHAEAVYLPELNRIVTGAYMNVLHFWDATTGELLETVEFYSTIEHLKACPGGKKIAIDIGLTNQIWDAATVELLHSFPVRGYAAVREIEFSPSGKYLGSMGCGGTFIWDTETGEEFTWEDERGFEINQIRTGWSEYRLLMFTPDEKQIIAIPPEQEKTVFWDIKTGEPVDEYDHIGVLARAGIDYVQARDVEGDIEFRLLKSNRLLCSIPNKLKPSKPWEIFWQRKFHPSGNVIAIRSQGEDGEPGAYEFYSVWTGELLNTISGIRDLQFAADGDYIFLVDDMMQLGLYKTDDVLGKEISGVFAVHPQDKKITTLGRIKQTQLLQNYPNPFNPETWIPYYLERDSEVTIRIYSHLGELINILPLGKKGAGTYLSRSTAAYWDGRNGAGEPVASGVYFYTVQAGEYTATRKMTVIR